MSTKTLRKRIALVAVAALGAGVLVASPASATAGTFSVDGQDYDFSTSVSASNIGVCAVGATAATGGTTTANTLADNATNTAEMLATGSLNLTTGASVDEADDQVVITITGNAVFGGITTGTATVAVDPTQKILTATGGSSALTLPTSVVIKPLGVGTIQVKIQEVDAGATTATTQTVELITIAAKATCAAGVVSIADSIFKFSAAGAQPTSGCAATAANKADESGKSTAANEGNVFMSITLCDANGAAITETTSLITAEVTSGALVSTASATPTVGTAFTSSKATYFTIAQAGTAPWSGTITIKQDGAVIATKSAKITGAAASIEVSSIGNGLISGGDAAIGKYLVKDSAGNNIAQAITGYETFTLAQSAIATAGASSATPSPTAADPRGAFNLSCSGSKGGTVTGLKLKYTNSSLVSITSPAFSVTCGSATVATYSASLDKASYVPGDIATLTISAKDGYGNAVSDTAVLGSDTAGQRVSVAGSNMTAVVAPTNADTFSNGSASYKFVVGSTEGAYNLIVDLAKYNTSAYSQSAVTVAYKIAASSTAVSNADVLKAIVSLIASINKQIAALQKALLKR